MEAGQRAEMDPAKYLGLFGKEEDMQLTADDTGIDGKKPVLPAGPTAYDEIRVGNRGATSSQTYGMSGSAEAAFSAMREVLEDILKHLEKNTEAIVQVGDSV